MVEVGQISIKAKVDTTALDSGTKKVKSRFKEMDASGKMSENSFNKIGSIIGKIGTGLAVMGTAGIAALSSLASKAPAVAGALASMKVTTGELTRFLGEQFKGEFNWVSEKYSSLVNWMKDNPLTSKVIINTAGITTAGILIGGFINTARKTLGGLFKLIAKGGEKAVVKKGATSVVEKGATSVIKKETISVVEKGATKAVAKVGTSLFSKIGSVLSKVLSGASVVGEIYSQTPISGGPTITGNIEKDYPLVQQGLINAEDYGMTQTQFNQQYKNRDPYSDNRRSAEMVEEFTN